MEPDLRGLCSTPPLPCGEVSGAYLKSALGSEGLLVFVEILSGARGL